MTELHSMTSIRPAMPRDRGYGVPQLHANICPRQVAELYKNCIKLASENKISTRNTWSLNLIDHISDLVKPSYEEGRQTNFQRASCTLDAGVKIYAYRVDSVHSDVYKVMSGLSRSAGPEPEAAAAGGGGPQSSHFLGYRA